MAAVASKHSMRHDSAPFAGCHLLTSTYHVVLWDALRDTRPQGPAPLSLPLGLLQLQMVVAHTMTEALQPVASFASLTVLNTGSPRCVVPPFFGVISTYHLCSILYCL